MDLKLETYLEKLDTRTKYGKFASQNYCALCHTKPVTHAFCLNKEGMSHYQMYLCFECAYQIEHGEHSPKYEREANL
jgi:hypothetical protein